MFPNRVPMERDALSPEPMVYSFIYIHQSPQLRSPPTKVEKTYSHHPWKAYIQWVQPGSPRVLFMTLLSLPQCHAAFNTIPSTLAWVGQSPVSHRVF
jgi:hypothetical protein